jgi:hypothetical protein
MVARKSNRSSFGWDFGGDLMDAARDRPMVAAAAAAAAVGAGVFLWSRRNQISNQLSQLSDQISEWTQNFQAGDDTGGFLETDENEGTVRAATSQAGGRTTGSRSLGARTGGGTTGSLSGRGRGRRAPTT